MVGFQPERTASRVIAQGAGHNAFDPARKPPM